MQSRDSRRTRRTTALLGLTVLLMIVASAWIAHSDSLFPVKKSTRAQSGSGSATASALYSDLRAHDVGDVLTVIIAESTSAQSNATTKTSQDDSVNVNAGTGLFQRLFRELSMSATNSRAGNGSGATTRSGTLVTTLAVLVKEVLPNGTLRVEGSRYVGINRETQKVVFNGIVRPEDIATDNTIASNLIADVTVRYDGKGAVAEQQHQGILSRLFSWLF